MNIAILFGSSTNEHEVSVVSATSIIKNLNKEKYHITPIYMDKQNNFYKWLEKPENVEILPIGTLPTNLEPINNIFSYLKKFNLVFIMIHGKNGEDGLLSSLLELLNIPYIGNKPAPSMITMDKIITKDILEINNIKTSKYLSFTKYNNEYLFQDKSLTYDTLLTTINQNLNYPLFVKPANSGSSIGITKVKQPKELSKALNLALSIDERVLIEEEVIGKEIECGILEHNNQIIASKVGEVLSAEEFYSFNAKYTNQESKTQIPADIPKEQELKLQELAIKAFKILNLHGYSRCDFFITNNQEIILNEINTIPGFTNISMYPKLFEASGLAYSDLLDILINEAIKRKTP